MTNTFTFMVKCYIAMRKNRQLLHMATHMNPLTIMLGKRNQAQSNTYIHLNGVQKQTKRTCDDRDQNSGCSVGDLVGRVHEIAFWAQGHPPTLISSIAEKDQTALRPGMWVWSTKWPSVASASSFSPLGLGILTREMAKLG